MISPLSVVHANCKIGDRSTIWQFASVIRGSIIGDDCTVATCATVDGCKIGDRVLISHGAFLDPGLVVGNDVFIGPGVKLCNDMWPRVDKDGWFDMKALLSGIVVTKICDGASIGAGAIVLPGITIGQDAMVAAGSVVTKNVGAGMLYRRDGTQTGFDEAQRRSTRTKVIECSP